MAELVDARDLKSLVPKGRAGSSPASGTSVPDVTPVTDNIQDKLKTILRAKGEANPPG